MENNIFRLVVFAIVAVFLLWLFYFYFAPAYIWKEEPVEVVEKNLQMAEVDLGHYYHQETEFPEDFGIKAEPFENKSRSIVFECNHDVLCCPEGKDCERVIEWDNNQDRRFFSFKLQKPLDVSARCRHEEIYICRVYLGEQPAQVNILDVQVSDKQIDLDEKQQTTIEYTVENEGSQEMLGVQGKATLYKILTHPYSEEPERVFLGEFFDEIVPLGIGEKLERELVVEITKDGNYLIEFTVFEPLDETNYETEEMEVSAKGTRDIGPCIPGTPMEEWYSEEECRYYLPCEDCQSIYECMRKWIEELGLPETFDGFEITSAGDDIVLMVDGWYTEGDECETLCYNDWDVIKELRKHDTPLEIFIVLDASGSMQEEIFALKNTINQIIEELRDGCVTESGEPCISIGIYVLEGISFSGYYSGWINPATGEPIQPTISSDFRKCEENCPSDSGNDVGEIPLTTNLDRISDGLTDLLATGGVEPWADVVVYSMEEEQGLNWNPDSHKAVIVMTDEMTNGGTKTVFDAIESVKAKNGKATAYAVWSAFSGPDGTAFPELDTLATQTGGLSENYLLETEIPGILLKIIVHAVRKTALGSEIKYCDEAICPIDCSCDWWSYPGGVGDGRPDCSEQTCEDCAKEKCLPLCVLPGTESLPRPPRDEPEERCAATECIEDRGACKTWLLCECQCIMENDYCKEMCREEWEEKLAGSGLEIELDYEQNRAFVAGTCNEGALGACLDCDLAEIEGCHRDYVETSCNPLDMECECSKPEETENESFTPEGEIIIKPPMVIIPTQPGSEADGLQTEPLSCHGLAYSLAQEGEESKQLTVYRISGPNSVFSGHNAGPYVVVATEEVDLERYISDYFSSLFPGVNYYKGEEEIRIKPDYVSELRPLRTCVINGNYDSPSLIFSKMKIPFNVGWHPDCQALIIGCPGMGALFPVNLRTFVDKGGVVIGTDGVNSTANVVLGAFRDELPLKASGDQGSREIFEGSKQGRFDLPVKLKRFFQVPFEISTWHLMGGSTAFANTVKNTANVLATYYRGSEEMPAVAMFGHGKGIVFHYVFHIEGTASDAVKAGITSSAYAGAFSERILLYPPSCETNVVRGENEILCPQEGQNKSLLVSNLFVETVENVRLKAFVDGREVRWINFSPNNFDLESSELVAIEARIPEALALGRHPLEIRAEAENATTASSHGSIFVTEISSETGEEEVPCTYTFRCESCPDSQTCMEQWRAQDDSLPLELEPLNANSFYYSILTDSEGEREGCEFVSEQELAEPTVEEPVIPDEPPITTENCDECTCYKIYKEQGPEFVFLDIIFVLDDSGSMANEVQSMKEHIVSVLDKVSETCLDLDVENCARIGFYQIFKPNQDIHLTMDYEIVAANLPAHVGDGGDGAEPWASTALVAINEEDWRRTTKKVIVVMTDAPNNSVECRNGSNTSYDYWVYIQGGTVACDEHKYYLDSMLAGTGNKGLESLKVQANDDDVVVYGIFSRVNFISSQQDIEYITRETGGKAVYYDRATQYVTGTIVPTLVYSETVTHLIEEIIRAEGDKPDCSPETCEMCAQEVRH